MYSQTILVVLTFLLGCEAFYHPISVSRGSRGPSECLTLSKPCRLRVTMRHFNGTIAGEISSQSCSCPSPRSGCPDDWSLGSHVISRNLISTHYNMTIMMMFCDEITPRGLCSYNDEALEVLGQSNLPTQIVSYNCLCNDNSPLMLHRRWVGSDHFIHHAYVCPEHKLTCSYPNSQCLVSHREAVFYLCDCQFGHFCNLESQMGSNRAFGYCRPNPPGMNF